MPANGSRDLNRFGIGEWYGRSFTRLTPEERRAYAEMQALKKADRLAQSCPFRSSSSRNLRCSKEGGVCSLRLYTRSAATGDVEPTAGEAGRLRTVCPKRFEEGGLIYRWVGEVLLHCDRPLIVREVGFLGAVRGDPGEAVDPDAAEEVSRIDEVLVFPDVIPMQWCALEVQAVYFEGAAMSRDLAAIRDCRSSALPFPQGIRQPDYRSSGPKRLMPQLQIKVPPLRRWGKKMAVVIDEDFMAALAPMEPVKDVSNCDIAWFVVKYDQCGPEAKLVPQSVLLTTLERAVEGITAGLPVSLETFEERIRQKLAAVRKEA